MSGSQYVTVERLPDDVTLSAATTAGDPGRLVTFTPHPLASNGAGGVMQWTWAPDSGTARTVACSYGANPCVTRVYESGSMDVAYYFNMSRRTRHAKVHVLAVPCPTGDSLMDNVVIRNGLTMLWSQSGADSAGLDPAGRRERGFYGGAPWSDPLHVNKVFISAPNPGDTPCSNGNLPGNAGSFDLLVGAHVHPFSINDPLPSNCGAAPPGSVLVYGHGYGGPSGNDWKRSFDDQLPQIVGDRDSVYVIETPPDSVRFDTDPATNDTLWRPLGDWRSKIKSYSRASGSCKLF